MSQAKQLQRRFIEEVWNRGNYAVAFEVLSPSATVRGLGREVGAFEGLGAVVASFRSAFPDLTLSIVDQIEEGGVVTARWKATGTHRGALLGLAPTGRRLEVEGHSIDHVAGGLIVATATHLDPLEILLQLGAQPTLDRSKAVVLRLFSEVWSSGKVDVAEEIVAADARIGRHSDVGPSAVKALVKGYRSAIPDLTFEVLSQTAEKGVVCSTWVAQGHHRGTLLDVPATGRFVRFNGSSIDRVVDGKIRESDTVVDVLDLLMQVGATIGAA